MRGKTLATRIKETKIKLQANDYQMSKHLRVSLANYKALESGAKVLPLPTQKTLERRMEGLLERCGL